MCIFETTVSVSGAFLLLWGMESMITFAQLLLWQSQVCFLSELDQRAGPQVVFHFFVWWDEVQLF